MSENDSAAAMISRKGKQFREKAGGKKAGISPGAFVTESCDLFRGSFPPFYQFLNTVLSQQRLVTHTKKNTVAVLRQSGQP